LFNPSILSLMKKKIKNKLDMNELFNYLNKSNKKNIIFPLYEKWLDIGNMKNYIEAKNSYK